MSRRWIALAIVALLAAPAGAEEAKTLATQKEKLSYGIGMNIGRSMKADGLEVDVDLLAQGIRDVFSGAKPLLTDEEHKAAMTAAQKEVMERQQEMAKKAAEKNKKEGEAFLAANGKKEGVVTLPSGLQYKVLKSGDGKTPTAKDVVETNYRGTLIDNTEFDSSYKRGKPASFPVGSVIPGWTEALQKMKVGDKWELYIPSNLAYGERGMMPTIGPNSTLIFEIELLGIK